MRAMRVPLGAKAVDDLLGGGFEGGCITLLFGEAGGGKTKNCLPPPGNGGRGGEKGIYIDTEGGAMEGPGERWGGELGDMPEKTPLPGPDPFCGPEGPS